MQKSFVHKPICQESECDQYVIAKGLCSYHYQKAKRIEYRASAGYACRTRSCKNRTRERAMFCDDCKTKPSTAKARKKRASEAERQAFIDQKPTCTLPDCGAPVAAMTPKANERRMTLCERHCSDMSHKGLALGAYIEMMSIAACQSCGSPGPLVTDHDHSCAHVGKNGMCSRCIRGRICSPCNTSLGSLGEDPARIRALADYAERIKAL